MAKKKMETKGQAEACPTFTISADKPDALRALIAALREISEFSDSEREEIVREFELYGARK